MTGVALNDCVNYTGQEYALRKLCLSRNLISSDRLALLTLEEVCSIVADNFDILAVCKGGERILLVEKDKVREVLENIVTIDR